MNRSLALLLFLGVLLLAGGMAAAAGAPALQGPISHVIGDVVVPAGTVVQGDVAVAVGKVQVDGTVTGSVSVGVGDVVVNGDVGGDVRVGVGNIEYGPQGKVGGATQVGPLRQEFRRTVDGPQGKVGGATQGGVPPAPGQLPIPFAFPFASFAIFSPLFGMLRWLGSAAIALPVVALFPDAVGAVTAQAAREPVRAGLMGLAAFVLAVPVFIVVAITIIGIPIVVLAAIALVAAVFFGYVGVSVWIGEAVLGALRGSATNRLWAVLAGSLLVALAGLVPILGGLISLAVSAVGLGAILLWRFRGLRGQPPLAGA